MNMAEGNSQYNESFIKQPSFQRSKQKLKPINIPLGPPNHTEMKDYNGDDDVKDDPHGDTVIKYNQVNIDYEYDLSGR